MFAYCSGSYMVEVPWNTAFDRELTPAETVDLMCTSPCVKKPKPR